MVREADVNDPKQVSLLDANDQPGRLEPEIVDILDDKEDHITGVENDENLGGENVNKVAGVHKETENVRQSHRVRLRNPRYYNDGVANATISDEDLPKIQECNQPRRHTEEDMVRNVFKYVLT